MVNWILGPSGAGKTEVLYRELADRLEREEPSWILVPEQFSLSTEKEILQRFGLSAQTGVKVVTFSRLCNLVLHRFGPLRMRYIDGAGKQIIAARTMELLQHKLAVLGQNLRQKGFAQTLVKTISECKRYGISAQVLRFAAKESQDEAFSLKLEDLALLYETYDQLIEAGHADAEDNLTLVCPRLRDCDFLTGKLFVWHFRSFTPIEQKALGELMHRMDLCFVLDHSEDACYGNLFNPIKGTIRKLEELAREEEIGVRAPILAQEKREEDALAYLKTHYFDPRAKAYLGESDMVQFYETQNRYREIETAADLILRLCRTEQLRFRDVLILARNIAPYQRILPAVFGRRGIRVFLDTRRKITEKPLVRLLSGMFGILAYGYSYERIMALARTGLFPLSKDAIDTFENYILATAPPRALWQAEAWTYQPNPRQPYDLEEINQVRNVLTEGVKVIAEKIVGRKTGAQIAEATLAWLKDGTIFQGIQEKIEQQTKDGNPELAEEYQQVWNAVLSVLAQISAIMTETEMTYRGFAELFDTACDGIEVGLTPQTMDCVTLSQIDRFRSGGAKVVLVLDMNEGVFPQSMMAEGFLSDAERRNLEQMGIQLAPGLEEKQREEQLLIYAVLSAPRERLYLFRGVADKEGKTFHPSGILQRIKELLPQIRVENPDLGKDPMAKTEGRWSAFDLLAAALTEQGGRVDRLAKPLQELYAWFQKQESHRTQLEKLEKAIGAVPPEELSMDLVEQIYGKPLMLSATQLETYNACAFQYFLTYGLLVRERQIAEVEPRSMGSVLHAALCEYFTTIKETGGDFDGIDRESCYREIAKAVETAAKENAAILYESSSYYQYIVLRMKGIAARTGWEVVKFYQSSAFRPYGLEMVINTAGDIPRLEVKAKDGSDLAKVRGFIDRVDTAKSGEETLVSVVDYKSSAKGLNVELVKNGITLQPLLYTQAVCNQIPKAKPAAMVYLQMNDPILKEKDVKKGVDLAVNKTMAPQGWIVDEAEVLGLYEQNLRPGQGSYRPGGTTARLNRGELELRMKEANERIQSSAEAIAMGKLRAQPYRSYQYDACEYCLYSGVCGQEPGK